MSNIKTVVVDDEHRSLNYLTELCLECPDIEVVKTFTNPHEALAYIKEGNVQLALLDIEMPELSGMAIASEISKSNLSVGVIFVTGYEQYALEAFENDAVAYLLKPAEPGKLTKAVSKVQHLIAPHANRVFIRTFGHFDVFVEQEPLYFANAKAKELLAVLVDRQGGVVTMDAMVDRLWENRPYDDNVKQLYRKAVNYLNKLLEDHGLAFFVANRGSCYIKKLEVNCDLFDLLNHKPHATQMYNGEYMVDYSWSEYTIMDIENFITKF